MKSRTKLILASAVVLYLVFEGLCFFCLWLLPKVANIRYDPNPTALTSTQEELLIQFLQRSGPTAFDSTLGWVNPPAHTNLAGIRDDREYEYTPRPGVLRIEAFGDSFTFGGDAPLDATWAKQMAAIAPSIEVLNFGVGAYGFDQAYLRYLKVGEDYHPNIVLIGYMSENLCRDVNVFRPFYTTQFRNVVFSKPRFRLENNQLVLLPNPLSTYADYEKFLRNESEVLAQLGQNDHWYQVNYSKGPLDFLPSVRLGKVFFAQFKKHLTDPVFTLDGRYNERSEAYQVTTRIFDAFYQKALDNGELPIILVFPDINDQARNRRGETRRYAAMLDYFRSRGYRYIDVQDALEPYYSRYSVGQLTTGRWGHYSPLGNKIVAEYMLGQLKAWDLLTHAQADAAAQRERQRLAGLH